MPSGPTRCSPVICCWPRSAQLTETCGSLSSPEACRDGLLGLVFGHAADVDLAVTGPRSTRPLGIDQIRLSRWSATFVLSVPVDSRSTRRRWPGCDRAAWAPACSASMNRMSGGSMTYRVAAWFFFFGGHRLAERRRHLRAGQPRPIDRERRPATGQQQPARAKAVARRQPGVRARQDTARNTPVPRQPLAEDAHPDPTPITSRSVQPTNRQTPPNSLRFVAMPPIKSAVTPPRKRPNASILQLIGVPGMEEICAPLGESQLDGWPGIR